MEFAFSNVEHEYIELPTGVVLPHITGLLEQSGWVDTKWFTDESRDRGSAVHRMACDYDLGTIEHPDLVNSKYKAWLLAHVSATQLIQPKWTHVEVPLVHHRYRYGGRPDRAGLVYDANAIVELKSGGPEKAHAVQLALQALLFEQEWGIPAEFIPRYGLYLKGNGKFKLEAYLETGKDFREAHRIIQRYCQ